jgi:hypothetical protein
MHSLTSSLQKRLAPAPYTRLDNPEPTDPGAWKARLAEQLPLHDRSPFDQLISDYLNEDKKPGLSLLVCECMKHGSVDVLAYVLANEDIKRLEIEGPFVEQGWITLAKAMPEVLHATELALSKDNFDADKCKQLFRVLEHMPELQKLSLSKLTEEEGNLPDCPHLPKLAELEVFAKSDSKAGGFRLPLKILSASKVRRLSIEESGAISTNKHSRLAKLLPEQTLLESLRLKIDQRHTPKQFVRYMQFLSGKTRTPLVELDLSSCCIGVRNLNQLVEALSQNQPALARLSLSHCGVAGQRKRKETLAINLLPLAGMNSLTHLDLSDNLLPPEPTTALIEQLQKSPNRVEILNLNRNFISRDTYSAMASFLRDNATLRRLSFEPPLIQGEDLHYDVEVLETLVEAMEQNKCLLELEFHWSWPIDEHRVSVDAYLDRNKKQAFMDAASHTAAAFVMPRLLMGPGDQEEFLNRRQLPPEFVRHIIGHGLTEHDALTLSSLNHETRASHEEFLRKAGS